MITEASAIVSRLEALLGPAFVTTAETARWTVDGIVPRAAVWPGDAEQVAAVLRVCAESGAAVVPWGSGTTMEVGNPPRAADVVLLTDRLSSVVDHDASNLTVAVQAGIRLATLDAALASHRQFLPLEPPRADAATAGGAVAVNLNGPRRARYGSARDLIIGVRAAQTSGEVTKSGGKTVKNVAGYDMGRLFVGSLGTLAVITELTFKVVPLPETSETVAVWSSDAIRLAALAGRITDSPLVPSAVVFVNPAAAQGLGRDNAGLLVRAEGVEPAVVRHRHDITGWAAEAGLASEALTGDAEVACWRRIRDFGWTGEPVAVRLTVPPGQTWSTIEHLDMSLPATTRVAADPGTGTVWLGFVDADEAVQVLPALDGLVTRAGGHRFLARAPLALRAAGDVWAPPPAARALEITRGLKQAFDPQHILNPGRFVAGL